MHIAVPAVSSGEDQGVHHTPPPGFPVLQQAHLPEVDLAFLQCQRTALEFIRVPIGMRGADPAP